MLIAARHLLDRLRQPRSRADEVHTVRRRLVAQPSAARASEEQVRLARELRRLREELTRLLDGATSCSGCARGHSLPHGRWSGGQCCGGHTEEIFTDHELAALRLSGTTPARLAPPRSDHAGCAFRGPLGCSLDRICPGSAVHTHNWVCSRNQRGCAGARGRVRVRVCESGRTDRNACQYSRQN